MTHWSHNHFEAVVATTDDLLGHRTDLEHAHARSDVLAVVGLGRERPCEKRDYIRRGVA